MKHWLFGKRLDFLFLFVPVWICWAIAFVLPGTILHSDVPLWVWVLVVIGIDVSHVWSSIHRTYFDKEEFNHHRKIFVAAPILSFVVSFGLAAFSIDLFWRCLAYVAVYHFVKQQFGFMRIYKAKAHDFRTKKISDAFIIYLSMLYPIIYWHVAPNRAFVWFVKGDFVSMALNESIFQWFTLIGNGLYFGFLAFWLVEEWVGGKKKGGAVSTGKLLWVLTTAGNWYLGIVHFNSDLVFTITNVVAHGLPYFALVIFYQTKKKTFQTNRSSLIRNIKIAVVIVLSVFLLALTEEYLWDVLVYRENESLFSLVGSYPLNEPPFMVQLFAIGLLAVPQATHYILDGFIWKNNDKNPYLKKILFD